MTISGFTIIRNANTFKYPVLESIRSILPICDEFIVNVGDSDDKTLELIQTIKDPKIRIIQTIWNMTQGSTVLSAQTNIALKECKGDWAFYLQSDEVIHEEDLPKIKECMYKNLDNAAIDALRFKWLHFFGSFWRYRIDKGWYQKQDRIIRNNGQIESVGDAFGFARKDGKPLVSAKTDCLLYHYGWVYSTEDVKKRVDNAATIGYADDNKGKITDEGFGDLSRYPVYFGMHPKVMGDMVGAHALSNQDWKDIQKKYWWYPGLWYRIRYKTGRREKKTI